MKTRNTYSVSVDIRTSQKVYLDHDRCLLTYGEIDGDMENDRAVIYDETNDQLVEVLEWRGTEEDMYDNIVMEIKDYEEHMFRKNS